MTENPNQPVLIRLDEAARLLGLGRSKTFEMAARGELPGVVRFGRSVRIHRAALERWAAERAGVAPDAAADHRPAA